MLSFSFAKALHSVLPFIPDKSKHPVLHQNPGHAKAKTIHAAVVTPDPASATTPPGVRPHVTHPTRPHAVATGANPPKGTLAWFGSRPVGPL